MARSRSSRASHLAARRPRARRGGRHHPRRRRGARRRRVRLRGGDHRRVRARPQGAGHRCPLLRHGRHADHLGLAAAGDHGEPRRDLPRPDDRARRGRGAAEDAERDRPQHPHLRPDADLPDRRRHAPALRDLFGPGGQRHVADRPARRAHPDDDRRAPLRHRHRGDGPARAAQCARHLGPRGRGGGRHRRAAARQDGHDHLRQPARRRVHPRRRAHRARR